MDSTHKVIFGNCRDMHEVPSNSIHLTVTSPPYYNAPFDYPDLFENYGEFLELIETMAKELYRVTAIGRIVCLITDDILVKSEKYPVVADITRIMKDNGFRYRDRIVWAKPKGYTRISKRSGILVQHPYPMYFYPDNIQESIVIFQKGKFEYDYLRRLSYDVRECSRINLTEYNLKEWYLTIWNITNVLPVEGRLEEGIAAFPEEIAARLIKLFSFVGETVLDPFLGSGTTSKMAKELGRNSIGYEIDLELKSTILRKLGCLPEDENGEKVVLLVRPDARKLRTSLQRGVKKQKSVTGNRIKI